MEPRKEAILSALDAFVRQRAGLEFGNYGDVVAYRAEQRSITRDLHDYRELANYVRWHDSIGADALLEASRDAFSGRLTISGAYISGYYVMGQHTSCAWYADKESAERDVARRQGGNYRVEAALGKCGSGHGVKIDYCTGQYFPTEYRKAACAVLASAIWAWLRSTMPAPTQWRVESWARLGDERERSPLMQIHAACELLEQKGGQPYGHVQDYIDGKTPGDWLRANARREFGRGIASRYFN